MSETPAKIKSKYAVRMERDFDNPKWIEQHKHMFNFLDVDESGKISRDELVFKSNEEICTAIKAAPEQKKRQQKCIEDFFGGAGLKLNGLNTLKGGKSWLPRSGINGQMKNQHSSANGMMSCLKSSTKMEVVQSP